MTPRAHQPKSGTRITSIGVAVAMAAALVVGGAGTADAAYDESVDLGVAESFVVLTSAAIVNTAGCCTTFHGDVGVGAGFAAFGPGDGTYTGVLRQGPAQIAPALAATQAAYDELAARSGGAPITPTQLVDPGGVHPGIHTSVGALAAAAATTITLDGDGDPDAVFVFQVNGALSLGAGTVVVLTDGAQAKNVFWQVNGGVGLGAGAKLVGTALVLDGASVGVDGIVNGRLLTLTGAVNTNNVQVYFPVASVAIDSPASSAVSSPTITGTTNAALSDQISITIGTSGPHLVSPTASHTFALTPPASPTLIDGTYSIIVTFTDAAGNIGTATQSLTIDTEPPALSIEGGSATTTGDTSPTISGMTNVDPGSIVDVTLSRTGPVVTLTRRALVQLDNSWNVTPTGLTGGTWDVQVTVRDLAGNSTIASEEITIDLASPATTITSPDLTADSTPTISGITEIGSTVTVAIDGRDVTTVQADAVWSATSLRVLGHGGHLVAVRSVDAAGNATIVNQALEVDLVAPLIGIAGGDTASSTDVTPTINGTSDVAVGGVALVSVSIDGGPQMLAVVQAGAWNVTPSTALAVGAHQVVATVHDPAGNSGTDTQTLTIDVGTADPSDPGATDPDATDPDATDATVAAGFTAVGPKRVFDTRAGQSPNAMRAVVERQVTPGAELVVEMTDLAGFVPSAGVGAVSLNVTSTGSAAGGFVTVYACGDRELVSSVNFAAGRTVANAVITPVSTTGDVCFYASSATDIIVDINGWFASGAAFTPVGPKRVFDTRPGNSPDALRPVDLVPLAAESVLEVELTDLEGYVPSDGVGAVSLNVTVTDPQSPGFVTVFDCGARPDVSSVNFAARQTVANAVVAPISPNGTVCFYSLARTDLIVDLNGWLRTDSDFVAVSPARVLDTRMGESPGALRDVAEVKIGGGGMLEVEIADLSGVTPDSGVTAVSLNVTATNTEGPGFVTVFACGEIEAVSSLNFSAGTTVANAVMSPVSPTGTICFTASTPTDIVVDINGYFHR